MNNIDTLRFWTQKILPLVYDDSLSYYEVLAKVGAKLNEVIGNVNEIPNEITKTIGNDDSLEPLISNVFNAIKEAITKNDDGTSETALNNYSAGSLVWLNGYLIRILKNIEVGDKYVEGINYIKIELETLIKNNYVPAEKKLYIRGIFDGTVEKPKVIYSGDVHSYLPKQKAIEISHIKKEN